MKILVIGGVAAGTKAAAKLKREQPDAQVVLYTKGQDISYAGCGLPYYVGGSIETREELIVNTPWKYAGLTRVEVHTGQEATALDAGAKTVTLRDTATGTEQTQSYDKLILAVGAEPFVPDVPGTALPGVFRMRTPDDAIAVRDWVDKNASRRAVVVGGGFIGLEVAENLLAKGLSVTVVDMAAQLMPNIFDPEMAAYVKRQLQAKGVRVLTGTALQGITGTDKAEGIATDGGTIPADLVVLAIGIRPATAFCRAAASKCSKAPSWWITNRPPTCPTSTPWATAPWYITPLPANPSGRPWAPPPTSPAGALPATCRGTRPSTAAAWAPAWSSCWIPSTPGAPA